MTKITMKVITRIRSDGTTETDVEIIDIKRGVEAPKGVKHVSILQKA